jgi:hypothetical protein
MIIVQFFRDIIDGPIYIIYVIVLVFLQLSLFGIIADRKRKLIQEGLQAKKARDIESGVEAEKAAMADKQILDVMDDEELEEEDLTKKEEAPSVLVIGADGSDQSEK